MNNIHNRGVNHVRIVRMFGLYVGPEGDRYIVTEFLPKGNIPILLFSSINLNIRVDNRMTLLLQ